jgi:hypothetical protein
LHTKYFSRAETYLQSSSSSSTTSSQRHPELRPQSRQQQHQVLYDFTQFREPSLPKLGKIIQFFLFFVVFREKSDEIRRNLTRFRVFVTHFWEQNRITQSREPSYYCFGSLKKMSKKNAKIVTQFWEQSLPFFQNYNPVLRATISVFSKLQPSFESKF